jgi:hypothetical protein
MPRYKHTKTGKFVSEYYAKRHPKVTVLVDQPKPRVPLLSGGDDPTLAERSEDELKAISRAAEFAERYMREHPETFKKLADS